MFPLMICSRDYFCRGYDVALKHHSCDIYLETANTGMPLLYCIMPRTVWLGVMVNAFNASLADRTYLYPAKMVDRQRKVRGYVPINDNTGIYKFSPPIPKGRATCFQ